MAHYAKYKTTRGGEPIPHIPLPCHDCATELMPDTPPGLQDWQWYMVHDHLWAAAGMDEDGGCLCIPCLERRLGRPLTGADLKPAVPVNQPGCYEDTPRLAELKHQSVEHWRNNRMETTAAWRNITGLTDEQAATMEEHERIFLAHHPDAEAILIEQAEYMAACNRIDAEYANLPVPAGARADRWVRDDNEEWSRSLEWVRVPTTVAAVDLYIDGRQNLDGSHTSQVSLYSDGASLTAEQARKLGRALLDAAAELDKLTEESPPFM
jgi:hypothetical protein